LHPLSHYKPPDKSQTRQNIPKAQKTLQNNSAQGKVVSIINVKKIDALNSQNRLFLQPRYPPKPKLDLVLN